MQGLVTTERNSLDPAAAPFAKNPRDIEGLTEGASIIEVVNVIGFIKENSFGSMIYFMTFTTSIDRKSTRLNSSHSSPSRMPSSA